MKEQLGDISVSVILCTLNEEQTLPLTIPRIPDWVDEVLMIDGHSTDNTVEVAKKLLPGIRILQQPGKGKGDALLFGIREASGDIIVTIDGDGETPPEEIGNFVKPLLEGYDLAKGSRLQRSKPKLMPGYRWFGNKVLSLTCNILYGTRFTDICSGYNGFWKEKILPLNLTCSVNEKGCSMEQQMIVRFKKAGMKVKEVPHSTRGRLAGSSAIEGYGQAIKQGFLDWFVIIRERFIG